MITSIHHGACKNNDTGYYEFCTIYGLGSANQQIHPVGYCREGKKKDGTPCKHTTEEDAQKCYQEYELEFFVKGKVQPKDLVFPRELLARLTALTVIVDEVVQALPAIETKTV